MTLSANGTTDGIPNGIPAYQPAQATVPIESSKLRDHYARFEQGSRKIRWDEGGPVQIDWSKFDRSKLTLHNLFIVKLVTFVESYADVYTKLLLDNFCADDTMATFFKLWEREEQNHADNLIAYLERVGLDRDRLNESLQRPRQRKFSVPYITSPLQASAFTYCQELLTAFFYQRFRRTVKEPLLDEMLTKIIADEWRHFRYYEYVVKLHLETDRAAAMREITPVFASFAMPGNQILGDEYQILTDEIVTLMRFSSAEIFQIGKAVTSTFGLIDGGKLLACSSYTRDMRDVMFRRKVREERHDRVVRAFTADLEEALASGPA
jgi:hypothetical protein